MSDNNSNDNLIKKENEDNNIINIHKLMNNENKETVIQGIHFNTKKGNRDFLKTIKRTIGIEGILNKMEDIDPKFDVFVFKGDYSEELKNHLIKDHNKKEELIKLHSNNFNLYNENEDEDFDLQYDNEINIHKLMRGNKKFQTVIQGLKFKNDKDRVEFLKNMKKKIGIGGCSKKFDDIDSNYEVFVFTGDYSDKIKDYLVNDYNKNEDFIKFHG